MSTRINKKFDRQLNPLLRRRRSGNHIEVSEPVAHGLRYRIPAKGANAEQAALLNSKIPGMTLIPKNPNTLI